MTHSEKVEKKTKTTKKSSKKKGKDKVSKKDKPKHGGKSKSKKKDVSKKKHSGKGEGSGKKKTSKKKDKSKDKSKKKGKSGDKKSKTSGKSKKDKSKTKKSKKIIHELIDDESDNDPEELSESETTEADIDTDTTSLPEENESQSNGASKTASKSSKKSKGSKKSKKGSKSERKDEKVEEESISQEKKGSHAEKSSGEKTHKKLSTDQLKKLSKDTTERAKKMKRPVMVQAANDVDNPGIVLALLDQGAKLNDRDNNGRTALHVAIQRGNYRLAHELIRQKASTKVYDNNGDTALHVAAHFNQIELAKEILQARGTVDAANEHLVTSLMVATRSGECGLAKVLLDKGASMDLMDDKRQKPIELFAVDEQPAPAPASKDKAHTNDIHKLENDSSEALGQLEDVDSKQGNKLGSPFSKSLEDYQLMMPFARNGTVADNTDSFMSMNFLRVKARTDDNFGNQRNELKRLLWEFDQLEIESGQAKFHKIMGTISEQEEDTFPVDGFQSFDAIKPKKLAKKTGVSQPSKNKIDVNNIDSLMSVLDHDELDKTEPSSQSSFETTATLEAADSESGSEKEEVVYTVESETTSQESVIKKGK